jgi:hypothetical protein
MSNTRYQSPGATIADPSSRSEIGPLDWWESRRLRYNAGLLMAGRLAFISYVIVCCTLLPRAIPIGEIKITPFTTLFQAVGYLLAMGVANVCYFLGPLSEYILQPRNVDRYRRVCFRFGFWFSVLLPFAIPTSLVFSVAIFPEHLQH